MSPADGGTSRADCHIHVFGNPRRYPPISERTCTPREADLPTWRAVSVFLGIERAVLIQPSAYGTDNKRMLDELRTAGNAVRGIAVVDEAIPDAALDEMDALGVRGVRLNLATGPTLPLGALPALVRRTAARVERLGWHIQVLARGAVLEGVAALVPALGVPVVFDHMAGAHLPAPAGPGFEAVLRLLGDGRCWVKLSGADHLATRRDALEEALPVMRALAETNPDRLVWGSDWPDIGKAQGRDGVDYLPIDHGRLLDLLRDAAGPAFGRILIDNPAALYGWS